MPFSNDVTMPVGAIQVTVSNVAGEEPQLAKPGPPPTPPVPPGAHAGDFYINRVDQRTWIYADDPANPGSFVWEPIRSKDVRGAVVYVGTDPFDPNNVVAPFWGMSADTQPSPGLLEPYGGDVYISTAGGDISLLAGPSPIPSSFQPNSQRLYVGFGPFEKRKVQAPDWGMPAGTSPDPATVEPQPGDIYIDTQHGDIMVLG